MKDLTLLFKERKEQVNKRKLLEGEIKLYNDRMLNRLVNLINPICAKLGCGVHVSIMDGCIEISTEVQRVYRKEIMNARVTMVTSNIYHWMESEKNLKISLNNLEKNIRVLKKIIPKNAKLSSPTHAIISIQTKDRYF
jgi:hypothetical protein